MPVQENAKVNLYDYLKNSKSILLTFLLIIALISCDEPFKEIDWELDKIPPRIVVDGSVTTELKHQIVNLSFSGDYYSSNQIVVSGARVSVAESNNVYNYHELDSLPGTYISDIEYAGKEGAKYTLNVDYKKHDGKAASVFAESTIQHGFEIDTLLVNLYKIDIELFPEQEDADTLLLGVVMLGSENRDIHNYYFLKLFLNGKPLNDSAHAYILLDDELNGINGQNSIEIVDFTRDVKPNDIIEVELYSISKEYFRFIEGVTQGSVPPDPFGFSGTPANAIGNINNGQEFGYFFASQLTRAKAKVVYSDLSLIMQ